MQIKNKIAILISWPRELDMFQVLIENISDDLVIVIDDLIYTESERSGNVKNIVELMDRELEYILLSKVLRKLKYNILFSTAQTFQERFTFRSYLKYYYAVSIGSFLQFFGLSNLFLKIINRPLTGGGKNAKKFEIHQIEREIGIKVIRYPKGLDVSFKRYPVDRWKQEFDMHLCHSDIDYNLIKNKFPLADCIKIGYPKYDSIILPEEAKQEIYSEFVNLDKSKPIIVWMPAHIKNRSERGLNLELWLPVINRLTKKYNVIVRPHPKTRMVSHYHIDSLIESNLIVDLNFNREMGILYQAADLILADYGGSVLDSIYMKKRTVLLNMSHKSNFYKWRKQGEYLDQYVRNDIVSIDYNDAVDLSEVVDEVLCDEGALTPSKLKNKYFEKSENYKNIIDILNNIKSEMF